MSHARAPKDCIRGTRIDEFFSSAAGRHAVAGFTLPGYSHAEFSLGQRVIAVLAGGDSAERSISLAGGQAVSAALRERGHQVRDVDPARVDLRRYDWQNVDCAFLVLHGKNGEDGHTQATLEELEVSYTGSNSEASRLGFSKSATKERLLQQHVPTPNYVLVHQSDSPERLEQHARSLGYPLVIKPDTQGSSIGVSIVQTSEQLSAALEKSFNYDAFSLMETCILGTEWTVGLLDDQILPPIQIVTPRAFFDFDAKYADDQTDYRFEFEVTTDVVRRIELVAQQACRALGTQGLARVDLRVDHQLRPWVLEINTIPGLTDHSLVPKAAQRIGWSFSELCERAVASALRDAHKLVN